MKKLVSGSVFDGPENTGLERIDSTQRADCESPAGFGASSTFEPRSQILQKSSLDLGRVLEVGSNHLNCVERQLFEDCETNDEIVENVFVDRLFGHVDSPVSVTEIYSGYLHFAEVQSSTFATSGSP